MENVYSIDTEFYAKKFAVKFIFDFFINQILMTAFHYTSGPLTDEEKRQRFDKMHREYGKFYKVIDEYSYEYVMDLDEMWNDKDKDGGFAWWVYNLYDLMNLGISMVLKK